MLRGDSKLTSESHGARHPGEMTISQLFEAQAQVRQEQVALKYPDEKLTFKELNQQAKPAWPSFAKARGNADVMVAICLDRSLEMVVAILGC